MTHLVLIPTTSGIYQPCKTLLMAGVLAILSACGGGSSSTSSSNSMPLNDAPGDVLSSAIKGAVRWSDPDTWNGIVPSAGEAVTIPSGQKIVLDTDIDLASLTINGTLYCGEQDLSVRAKWIMVHGVLQCGAADSPHEYQFDITLTGNDKQENVMSMGTKLLGAMGGGIISLHGLDRTSWLMLNETANPGDSSIKVEYATNWMVGDEIVIASTSDDMNQAEVRTISAVNGVQLELDRALQYRHYGEVQNFDNGQRNWKIDTRAEVGLLSRNIRIRGDENSQANRFGGHVMIMPGSAGFVSGVEFNQMGQEGILGRYPFHWHLANEVSGQYIRNSSIRKSYNRCITVHGSQNALVEDNVCFDHVGHGYFLEDGSETGNVFNKNLGLLTRRPSEELALLPSDIQTGEAARGPATFWISNPDNSFTGNAAAGSEGLGFWYDTENSVAGASANLSRYDNVKPITAAFGGFSDNRVHSSNMAFSSCSDGSGPRGYLPPSTAVYYNLTVFAGGDGAVWPCEGDQRFTEMKITDTGHTHHAGFVAPRPVSIDNSIFVANSGLSSDSEDGRQRNAIGIYDFGVDMTDVHFANFNMQYGGSFIFGARDADVRFTNNPVSNITLDDSYLYYDRRQEALNMQPSAWGAVIHDEDGSLGLSAGSALVADHPMMTDNTCTDLFGTGRLCGNRYGRVELDFDGTQNLPAIRHLRSDGREVVATPLAPRAHYQSVVSVNHTRYYYGYEFDAQVLAVGEMTISLDFLHDSDTVVLEFPNLPANTRISQGDYSVASSLSALIQGSGKQYLKTAGSLFIKLRASGERWHASDRVRLVW